MAIYCPPFHSHIPIPMDPVAFLLQHRHWSPSNTPAERSGKSLATGKVSMKQTTISRTTLPPANSTKKNTPRCFVSFAWRKDPFRELEAEIPSKTRHLCPWVLDGGAAAIGFPNWTETIHFSMHKKKKTDVEVEWSFVPRMFYIKQTLLITTSFAMSICNSMSAYWFHYQTRCMPCVHQWATRSTFPITTPWATWMMPTRTTSDVDCTSDPPRISWNHFSKSGPRSLINL